MRIFKSAILLTAVNLLLRLAGTSFQVYLSGRIGAAGIGLLQLVLSVGSLAMVAGIAGIRTASMYLTAEELGRKNSQNVTWILSGCILYSLIFSGSIAILLYSCAPAIACHWIADPRTTDALRLLAAFLPATCLCGVMTGYFTAANRIGTLALVEIGEQFFSMGITAALLALWAGQDPGRACQAVVFGSGAGGCFTLLSLLLLRLKQRSKTGPRIPVVRRLCHTALPLAAGDVLKSGITTLENLMVPKRLALNLGITKPLAAFGMVSGMVFPILMFPACILFGLAELLIPELARCAAAGSRVRITYLTRRGLRVTMVYGLLFCGLMVLLAEDLCIGLYSSPEAGKHLRLYAFLIPMLYCDIITDAMIKGLGQQKVCVRYNILTSAMDVILLFLLLPHYGMEGYLFSFFLTHLVNFLLSLGRLLKITGARIPIRIPIFSILAALAALWITSYITAPLYRAAIYPVVLGCILYLLKILRREDAQWVKGLVRRA